MHIETLRNKKIKLFVSCNSTFFQLSVTIANILDDYFFPEFGQT